MVKMKKSLLSVVPALIMKRKAIAFGLLLLTMSIIFISGCGKEEAGIAENEPVTDVTEYDGKTSVLLEDADLLNAYSGLTDENNQITWVSVDEEWVLEKGDIVLALREAEGMMMVYIPTGDTPMSLYGEVPSACLSQDTRDIEKGNLAIADNLDAYSDQGETPAETVTGTVRVIEHDGEWCRIIPLTGGQTERLWLKANGLSYDFDRNVLGRP